MSYGFETNYSLDSGLQVLIKATILSGGVFSPQSAFELCHKIVNMLLDCLELDPSVSVRIQVRCHV